MPSRVVGVNEGIVDLDPNRLARVVYSYEEFSSLGIHERSDRLDDCPFDGWILGIGVEVFAAG